MKTLEAKPFDQNAENWKRQNRLFTSTVLAAGASGQSRIGAHALRSHRTVWFVFAAQTWLLLETGIAGHERFSLAKWHPKAKKKLRRWPFFDITDRHEKLYGSIAAVRQRPRTPRNFRRSFAFLEYFLWYFNEKKACRGDIHTFKAWIV